MDFNDHSNLRGLHAFLSPSNYHWLNYDRQKMKARLSSHQAAARGTRIHSWANEAIRLGMRQRPRGNHIERYINDGIGFRMMTDFVIFYSPDAFGEADCLSFREEKGKLTLRVHDLKTGLVKAGMTQLKVYAAYFCLEYDEKPEDIVVITQIYQNDKVISETVDPAEIRKIMERTKEADRWVQEDRKELE
jgi:hypothetical protein